jgi:hypothetical protein
MVNISLQMSGDLEGIYYPLAGMTKEQEDKLQADGFLFQKPTPSNVLANCGAARDWPDARGIFHNKDKVRHCHGVQLLFSTCLACTFIFSRCLLGKSGLLIYAPANLISCTFQYLLSLASMLKLPLFGHQDI